MKFDFNEFSKITERVYRNMGGSTYTIDEVLSVFRYYFEAFEEKTGNEHFHIRAPQIQRIICAMPWIDENSTGDTYDVRPEDYRDMIDQHFSTQYRKCDYNILHFFSGRIRELRYFETCY